MINLYEIERYSANHPDWEGSFSERLWEYNEWNADEFWKLHKALTDLAVFLRNQTSVNKALMFQILAIQQSVQTIFSSHFNKRDICKIKNISEEQLREFMERFEHAIMAVASGKIISEERYDLRNPLLIPSQPTLKLVK